MRQDRVSLEASILAIRQMIGEHARGPSRAIQIGVHGVAHVGPFAVERHRRHDRAARAQPHEGDAQAEAKLVAKVRKGGKGVWGEVPMPPNVTVKEADVRTLVQYVLTLK